ncbi:hypothetical protein A2W40_02650 [Candidatus Giovannonibacteria bacterium RIFCSPHIGHO2_01_45_12]|nr:MAG: hypothetical protein A2W40_02650 [Candidatus Giovannonibacteria bacterium RIFCSPHIGHO2_01_45_12]
MYPNKPELIGTRNRYFVWWPMRIELLENTKRIVFLRWIERRYIPTCWPQSLSSCFLPMPNYIFEYRLPMQKAS